MFGFGKKNMVNKSKSVHLVVLKSDDMDEKQLEVVKKELKAALNGEDGKSRVGVFCIYPTESLEVITIYGD